jgi:hypothetical protein
VFSARYELGLLIRQINSFVLKELMYNIVQGSNRGLLFDTIAAFACTCLVENDENRATEWPTFQPSFENTTSQIRRRYSEVCGLGYELYRSSESVVVVVLVLAGWHGRTGRCYALHLLQVTDLARRAGVNSAGIVCRDAVVCNWKTAEWTT